MFKIDERSNKISITQGDNGSVNVNLTERGLFKDDDIKLIVSDNSKQNIVLEKNAVDGTIRFFPEDTKNLKPGYYVYSIQLTTFGGNIYTIVAPALFEICQGVSR